MSEFDKSIVLLAGGPGTGKTTAGTAAVEFFGADLVDHFSMGNAIRDFGKTAGINSKGKRRRPEVLSLFKGFLEQSESPVSLIDGFPRTPEQVGFYRKFARRNSIGTIALCHFEVPRAIAIERIGERGERRPNEYPPENRIAYYRKNIEPVVTTMSDLMPYVRIDSSETKLAVAAHLIEVCRGALELTKAKETLVAPLSVPNLVPRAGLEPARA